VHSYFRSCLIPLLLLSTFGCGDGAGPHGSLTVRLCPAAEWAGIQREGSSWRSITTSPSDLSLGPGERLGLARIRQGALQIYYVTAEQAGATFACETPTTKTLQGTIKASTTANIFTAIAMGSNSIAGGSLLTPEVFTLSGVPGGPTDLVASRQEAAPITIIRRGVDYPDGGTVPLLDFTSAEGFPLQANTLTVGGTDNLGINATTQLITQNGTQGILSYARVTSGSTIPIYSVPADHLVQGELHSVLFSTLVGRSAVLFYQLGSDRTVALGPVTSMSNVTRVGTAPQQVRIEAVSQPEYGAQVTISVCAASPTNDIVPVTLAGTKEYFGGTPTTWSLTIPNLLAVPGFPSGWPDPRNKSPCRITVTDRPYLFSPRSAHDGDTYRTAIAP
jgi:hypothetical protein